MADQRIQWDEKMAGSSFANPDTLNRLMLIEHDSSGEHTTSFRPSFHVISTAGAISLDSSGLRNINFTTIVYEEGAGWSSGATWTWTPPRSGKWLISANINVADVGATWHYLSLVKGASTEVIRGPVPLGVGSAKQFELNAVVNLSSANAYKLCFYEPRNGVTPDMMGFSSLSYFQGHFIGV